MMPNAVIEVAGTYFRTERTNCSDQRFSLRPLYSGCNKLQTLRQKQSVATQFFLSILKLHALFLAHSLLYELAQNLPSSSKTDRNRGIIVGPCQYIQMSVKRLLLNFQIKFALFEVI